MFGIGSTELLVILVIALLVLGPKNLPKIAQTIGKAMGQFQKVSKDFQRTLNTEIALEDEADKQKEQDKLVTEQSARKEANKEQNTSASAETVASASANTSADTTADTTTNNAANKKKTSHKSA